LQTGQFVLTGTTVIDQKATALLREVNGGRSRRVQQGETINGMLVAEVRSDRVKLTIGPDAETLTLKVAVGPKTTIQPQVAVAPPPQQSQQPPQQPQPQPQLTQPPPGSPGGPPLPNAAGAPRAGVADVGEALANRRRAARAAEATAQQGAGDQPAAAAPVPQAAPAQQEWSSVYQRYIQRQQK
jgi:hypothetical protein